MRLHYWQRLFDKLYYNDIISTKNCDLDETINGILIS